MKNKLIGIAGALCAGFTPHAFAQYPGWQHQGSCFILTTPEGADLPATATEPNFPLLLRLNKRVVLRDTLCELLCQVFAAPAVGLALLGSSCASTVGSSMWRALQCVL